MKVRRLLAKMGVGTAVVALAASATAIPGEEKVAQIGKPAPNFTLVDTNGQKRTLSEYAGRIIVLEWTNTQCPVVQKCYRSKAMQTAYDRVKELDKTAVWLAINSTSSTNAAQNAMWIKQFKLDFPILLDVDGTVGRQFDAKRTPHMFVIDKKGVLRYNGAIDDNAYGSKDVDETKNYVVNAVQQIIEGETVAPDKVKPYGCTVKYGNK